MSRSVSLKISLFALFGIVAFVNSFESAAQTKAGLSERSFGLLDVTPTPEPPPPVIEECPLDCFGQRVPDVDGDCYARVNDVQMVIRHLNTVGAGRVEPAFANLDINDDKMVTPLDALILINYINAYTSGRAEGADCEDTPPVLTPTPTPTPTPTSEPERECNLWAVGYAYCSGILGNTASCRSVGLSTLQNIVEGLTIDQNQEPVPSCFNQLVLSERCASVSIPGTTGPAIEFWGHCEGGYLNLADFLGVPEEGRERIKDAFEQHKHFCQYKRHRMRPECRDGINRQDPGIVWFMDKDCRYVDAPAGSTVCGFSGLAPTPLSLVWGNLESLRSEMTIVAFSLAADKPSNYSLWLASEHFPLLVYDPDDTGRVDSARQLFGEYAFGGRTDNPSDFQKEQLREPWQNGYQALALLDRNSDGKVSGNELDGIKLWFDKNRDGKVQSGELQGLAKVGVVALYYFPDSSDDQTGDLWATLGYERLVKGKRTFGQSVDWFSPTFSSKQEALTALSALPNRTSQKVKLDSAENNFGEIKAQSWQVNPLNFRPSVVNDHKADISGYWAWRIIDDPNTEVHPGILAFEQDKNNNIVGFSVLEIPLIENSQGLGSAVKIFGVEGTVKRDSGGGLEVELLLDDPNGVGVAKSKAILSEDGLLLRGSTDQTFTTEADGQSSTAKISYQWIATKVLD